MFTRAYCQEFCEKCKALINEFEMIDPTPKTFAYYRHQLLCLKNKAKGFTSRLICQKAELMFLIKFSSVEIDEHEYAHFVRELAHAEKAAE